MGLNLTRLKYPENGGIEIVSYQLFMRNVSEGQNDFSIVMEIPYFYSTENLITMRLPKNCIFEFFYRAVNQLGPGGNSSIVSHLSIDVPKTPLFAPNVSLSGTDLVIDWQTILDTKYYKVFLLDIDYYSNINKRTFLNETCNGTDPNIIADTKCTVPMSSMPWY
jgi:hypothetical protein